MSADSLASDPLTGQSDGASNQPSSLNEAPVQTTDAAGSVSAGRDLGENGVNQPSPLSPPGGDNPPSVPYQGNDKTGLANSQNLNQANDISAPAFKLSPSVKENSQTNFAMSDSPRVPPVQNEAVQPPPWLESKDDLAGSGGEPPPSGKEDKNSREGESSGGDLVKKSIFGKIIPILLILILLALFGFAVYRWLIPFLNNKNGEKSLKSKDMVSLTYWGLWEPEEAMAEIIADYQKIHPEVQINYQRSSYKDYRERLTSALSRKESDSSFGPDIFRWHNTWLPMMKEYLAPIEKSSINIDDYFPVIKKDVVWEGQTYGFPLMFDCLSLFYNVDLFNKAGAQVPTTWEEMQTTAANLTVWSSSGQVQTAGVSLGTANNIDHFSDILGLMMLQNNANLKNPTDNLASDALTFYTLFYTRDNLWSEALPNSTYAFATGKSAMFFAPSWRAFEIKQINPELNFKTAPVPQLPDSQIAWATYWVEGVAQASKYKKEATEFLVYLSQDEVMRQLYAKQSQTRLFGEIFPKPKLAEELKNDPIVGSFVNQAPYAQSWYMTSFTHDNALNDSIIKYYENAVNAMVGNGAEAGSVLTTVGQGVIQVLGTYGIR